MAYEDMENCFAMVYLLAHCYKGTKFGNPLDIIYLNKYNKTMPKEESGLHVLVNDEIDSPPNHQVSLDFLAQQTVYHRLSRKGK